MQRGRGGEACGSRPLLMPHLGVSCLFCHAWRLSGSSGKMGRRRKDPEGTQTCGGAVVTFEEILTQALVRCHAPREKSQAHNPYPISKRGVFGVWYTPSAKEVVCQQKN